MKHHASAEYWEAYDRLPPSIKRLADKQFELLKQNPNHPSLRFKRIHSAFVVRVGLHYRAVGKEVEDGVIWEWIGPHAEYNHLFK